MANRVRARLRDARASRPRASRAPADASGRARREPAGTPRGTRPWPESTRPPLGHRFDVAHIAHRRYVPSRSRLNGCSHTRPAVSLQLRPHPGSSRRERTGVRDRARPRRACRSRRRDRGTSRPAGSTPAPSGAGCPRASVSDSRSSPGRSARRSCATTRRSAAFPARPSPGRRARGHVRLAVDRLGVEVVRAPDPSRRRGSCRASPASGASCGRRSRRPRRSRSGTTRGRRARRAGACSSAPRGSRCGSRAFPCGRAARRTSRRRGSRKPR